MDNKHMSKEEDTDMMNFTSFWFDKGLVII